MASTVWKGHLTFGLLSLPVKLYSAARSETVSFNQLHKTDHSRVRQVLYCQAEDKPITGADIVKGYEYEKDKYVVIDDEDIKKVAPRTAKTMEVQEFVKSDEVDPIYFESSYYLAPDEAGEKAYALLFEALRQTKCVGVAKIAMHNREHIVILRPGEQGLMLHTMYYKYEIRRPGGFRTCSTWYAASTLARRDGESQCAPGCAWRSWPHRRIWSDAELQRAGHRPFRRLRPERDSTSSRSRWGQPHLTSRTLGLPWSWRCEARPS